MPYQRIGCRKTTSRASRRQRAFARGVDVEVGIGVVQVLHHHAGRGAGGVGQAAVEPASGAGAGWAYSTRICSAVILDVGSRSCQNVIA
jgi:hypothetical protein